MREETAQWMRRAIEEHDEAHEFLMKEYHGYSFVFRKNLGVTNMQFVELLALLRVHLQFPPTRFVRFREFSGLYRDLRAGSNIGQAWVREGHLELLCDSVVLCPLFGSCIVFSREPIADDVLLRVCVEAGYVFSCGECVYFEPLASASRRELSDAVAECSGRIEGVPLCVPYTHEDFDNYESLATREAHARGLHDLKFYIEKYYLGVEPFAAAMRRLGDELAGTVVVPEPGDYKLTHDKAGATQDALWIFVDWSLHGFERHDQALLCYRQQYANKCPHHLFDENKPAWIRPTTIPPALAAAMVNMTRPHWSGDDIVLYDPFCGTGTFALEGVQFDAVSKIECRDLDQVARQLIEDNVAVLAMDHTGPATSTCKKCQEGASEKRESKENPWHCERDSCELCDLERKLHHLDETHPECAWPKTAFTQAASQQSEGHDGAGWVEVTPELLREFKERSLIERVVFYLMLRTQKRRSSSDRLLPNQDEFWEYFDHEKDTLRGQVASLMKLRRHQRQKREELGHVRVIRGLRHYSRGVTVSPGLLRSWEDRVRVEHGRAEELPERLKACVDVVVTDPPYGFNTDEEPGELAQMYLETIGRLSESLKEGGGQVAMCLPEQSRTGRTIQPYARRGWVMRHLLAKVASQGRHEPTWEAVTVGVPFDPPYFWRSGRALERAIVHMRVKRRSQRDDGEGT